MSLATTRESLPFLSLLVLLCATVGALTAVSPIVAGILLVALAGTLLVVRLDRPLVAVFLIFLVLQDPFRFMAGGDDTQIGYFVKRADEALLYVVALWTLLTSRRTHLALRAEGIRWAILACFGGILASSVVARVAVVPAAMDLVLFAKPFLIFAVGCSIDPSEFASPRRLRTIVSLMASVILFALVFMLLPHLHDAYLGSFRVADTRLGLRSAQGFFDGPGPYSWFCATTFAVAYAAYLAFEKRAYALVSLVAAVFTVLSWRRKSIGGILAMILLAVLLRSNRDGHSRRRAVATIAIVAILGITLLAPLVSSLWQYTVKEYGGDPNSVARFALHQTSVLIARDHFPFGAGLASFGSHASSVYYSETYQQYGLSTIWGLNPEYPAFITDTFWPMVLGEGGVVTLIPYALFVFLLLRRFWVTARQTDLAPADRFLAFAGLFILVGSLLESTSSPIYNSTMQSALALVVPGIAWSCFASLGSAPSGRPNAT
jgi:hypothetical protein